MLNHSRVEYGQPCRSFSGAPARYLVDGLCLWIGAGTNELCLSWVRDRRLVSTDRSLVRDEALEAALLVYRSLPDDAQNQLCDKLHKQAGGTKWLTPRE